jgi:hypothetical protein
MKSLPTDLPNSISNYCLPTNNHNVSYTEILHYGVYPTTIHFHRRFPTLQITVND